jgi:hypothetical protein
MRDSRVRLVLKYSLLGVLAVLVLIFVLAVVGPNLSRTADVITVVLAPLAVVGLALGAWQLYRTVSATKAVQGAVQQTAQDFVTYQLLTLISEAHYLSLGLDTAARVGQADRAIEVLVSWNRVGGEIRGLLDGRPDIDEELLASMTESFALATTAKDKLTASNPSVASVTKAVRTAVGEVVTGLGVYSGKLKASIGQTGGREI